MREFIDELHKFLIKARKTVAVAESCTGGALSNLLTQTPGSSHYFILGIVAYSNRAKISILRVPTKLITAKGAVCRKVARNMAQSVRKLAKADFAIGITGIAGPTGGSKQKPVGTVFIAIDSKNKRICKRLNFKGSRSIIRKKTALAALELLKLLVIG